MKLSALSKYWPFIVILFVFAWAFRGFVDRSMIAFGDSPPFSQSASYAFNSYLEAWHPLIEGVNSAEYGIDQVFAGILILVSGGNAVLAKDIFVLGPFPLGFVCMYAFLTETVGLQSRFARFLASTFYVVNLWFITAFQNLDAITMEYVLFPILITLLFRLKKPEGRLANAIAFAMLYSLSFSLGVYFMFFIVPFAIYFLVQPILQKPRQSLVRFGWLSMILGLVFLLLLPFVISSIGMYGPILRVAGSPSAASPLSTSGIQGLITEFNFSYSVNQNFSPAPLLAFVEGVPVAPTAGYGVSIASLLLGIPIPLLAFGPLFFRGRSNRLAILFSTFGVLLLSVFFLNYWGLTLSLYEKLPFLLAWRNPILPCLLLMFVYSVLIGLNTDGLRVSFTSRGYKHMLVILTILVVIFAQASPLATGDMGLDQVRGRVPFLADWSIRPVYYEASDWLAQQGIQYGGPYRTLWAPYTYDQGQVQTVYLDPDQFAVRWGIQKYSADPYIQYVEYLYTSLANDSTTNFGQLLGPANVKYVVVNKDAIVPYYGKPDIFTGYAVPVYIDELNHQADLRLVENSSDFMVYENMDVIPHVAVFNNALSLYTPQLNSSEYFAGANKFVQDYAGGNYSMIIGWANQNNETSQSWFARSANYSLVTGPVSSPIDVAGGTTVLADSSRQLVFINNPQITDDFGPNSEYLWEPQGGGNWSTFNGSYYQASPSARFSCTTPCPNSISILGTGVNPDDAASVSLRIVEGNEKSAGLIMRYQNASNYYAFFNDERDGQLIIAKTVDNVQTQLLRVYKPFSTNQTYTLGASAMGSRLTIYLDGVPMGSVNDSTFGAGQVGLATFEARTYFNGFELESQNRPFDPLYTVLMARVLVSNTGAYRFEILSPSNSSAAFMVNSQSLNQSLEYEVSGSWHLVSQSVNLRAGSYEVIAKTPGDNQYPELVISSANGSISSVASPSGAPIGNENLEMAPRVLSQQMLSNSEYRIVLSLSRPAYLFFGEPFDQGWQANVNGKPMAHFIAFEYGNGYYINATGTVTATLNYDPQSTRTFMISIEGITWVCCAVGLVFLSRRRLLDSLGGIGRLVQRAATAGISTRNWKA